MLSTPTLVELCFQTAGIWEIGKTGIMALPFIQTLTLHRQNVNGAAVYAEVRPVYSRNEDAHFDARVVNSEGRIYLEMKEIWYQPHFRGSRTEPVDTLAGIKNS